MSNVCFCRLFFCFAICNLEFNSLFCVSMYQTPLHVAVITNQPAVVKRLLERDSSPNIVDLDGLTSIHHAAKLQSSSCLDCLLSHAKFPLKLDALTYDGMHYLFNSSGCNS